MKSIVVTVLMIFLTGCNISSNKNTSNNFSVRNFTFPGNENITLSSVTLTSSPNGLGCQASGVATNRSPVTCGNIFIAFNATDENGRVFSKTIDSLTNLPSNAEAEFNAIFPSDSRQVQCNEIRDIQLEITEYCR